MPNFGRYLLIESPLIINCILQTAAFTFELIHPTNPKSGDLELKVKMQSFAANLSEKPEDKHLPIWIFWYKPTDEILESMLENGKSICVYLHKNGSISDDVMINNNQIVVLQIPNPINENLEEGMRFLTNKLCGWFGRWVT